MISIVEDYLSELIENKLSELKGDLTLVDSILGLSSSMRDRLKVYLQNNDVAVIRGYPRGPADLPCVCILLSGEEETQMGLGDFAEDDLISIVEGSHTCEYVDVPTIEYPQCRIEGFSPVTAVHSITNITTGEAIPDYAYHLSNGDLGIIAFSDEGWASNGNQLKVEFSYAQTTSIDLETMFDANFRLEVWTGNGDLTVYLYHLIKWVMLSGRGHLINKGLFRQRLTGADFEPATSWMPDFVYRRALMLWCQIQSSVPEEKVSFIQNAYVNQSIQVDL